MSFRPGHRCAGGFRKQVAVRYTGKLLPSAGYSTEYDGSADPYKLVIGAGSVIPGWEDGLKVFKKGGKEHSNVPAFMAYDDRPGPAQAFRNLMFDVEVVDVTDAPPAAAVPRACPICAEFRRWPPQQMQPQAGETQQAQPHK